MVCCCNWRNCQKNIGNGEQNWWGCPWIQPHLGRLVFTRHNSLCCRLFEAVSEKQVALNCLTKQMFFIIYIVIAKIVHIFLLISQWERRKFVFIFFEKPLRGIRTKIWHSWDLISSIENKITHLFKSWNWLISSNPFHIKCYVKGTSIVF